MTDEVRNAESRVARALAQFAAESPGRSAVVESLRGTKVRAAARADEVRPGASLLKLPLVAAVRAAATAGEFDLSERVDVAEVGPPIAPSILSAFEQPRTLSLGELCRLCLMVSDNSIANHLLSRVGASAVNEHALRLGCRRTSISIGFGEDALGSKGRANVTTACDAVTLIRELVENDPGLEDALANNLRNTRIPLRLPESVRSPHKTGTLPGVANDVGIVYGERTDLALAFLCADEADTARASIAIGDCVATVRQAVGESVE